MLRLYPGYSFDEETRFVAGPTVQKVKFTDLKEMLLCKDLDRYDEIQSTLTENDKCSFLDESVDLVAAGESVAFQSYPRSGNTFLRVFLEKITGIYTGSDMNIRLIFHEAISMGLLGSNIVSDENRLWITKSHFPIGKASRPFTANKMIVIARNPIDALPSFIGITQLDSHSLVPEQ